MNCFLLWNHEIGFESKLQLNIIDWISVLNYVHIARHSHNKWDKS